MYWIIYRHLSDDVVDDLVYLNPEWKGPSRFPEHESINVNLFGLRAEPEIANQSLILAALVVQFGGRRQFVDRMLLILLKKLDFKKFSEGQSAKYTNLI